MSLFNLTSLGSVLEGVGGLATMQRGISLQALGGQMEADGYRMAADSVRAVSKYNADLAQVNFDRQMDALSKDIESYYSSARTVGPQTGWDVSSKSFLQATNDAMTTFERTILDSRASIKQQKEAIIYEGELMAVGFENQALAAEYRASQAGNQGFGEIAGLFQNILGAFG